MPRQTGLATRTIDVKFKGGLAEKYAPELAPPEGAYILENAELDKLGVYRRRRGFKPMSTAPLPPQAVGSFGTPKKVAGRGRELFAIAEQAGALGSGGGSGSAGSILWSYSPEWDAWREHAKVPSTTLERTMSLVCGQGNPQHLAAGTCLRNSTDANGNLTFDPFVFLAYFQSTWSGQSPGIHVATYDADSLTSIREDIILLAGTDESKIQCLQVGRYGLVVARVITESAADLNVWCYDAQATGALRNAWTPLGFFGSSLRGGRAWTVGTDGTDVFLLEIASGAVTDAAGTSADRDVTIHRFSLSTVPLSGPSITRVSSVKLDSNGQNCEPGLSSAGGRMHASWKDSVSARPRFASVTTALASLRGPGDVSTTAMVAGAGGFVYNAALNGDDVAFFWQGITTGPPLPTEMRWRWVKNMSSLPDLRANTHKVIGLHPHTQPFVINNRLYMGLTGNGAPLTDGAYPNAGNGGNYGHVVCEFNAIASAEDSGAGNPYTLPMPVALWSRDLSLDVPCAQIACYDGVGAFYMATIREARKSDSIFVVKDDFPTIDLPTPHTVAVWSFDVMKLDFSDAKRWQHAEIDDQTVLACSLPYCYNGDRAFECGNIFRPSIIDVTEAASFTTFTVGTKLIYIAVYEWEDFSGRRWFSDPSYPVPYTVQADGVGINIRVRPPWLTMKPQGEYNFNGRVKVNVYRAKIDAPDRYDLLYTQQYLIWDGSGLLDENYITVNDSNVDFSSTEKAYVFGGELPNSIAPSCRALIQHRDRLFAIDLEDNSLAWTKSFERARGIEWSRFFRKPLPQRGMALASLEGSLLVFTDKSILVLDGAGPSATGIPPDAFSRFAVLSQDHGCSEQCAAWRTPRGVVFRSHQGLWLVTPQLGLVYIGAAVEDVVRNVDYFVDASVDERLGCLRLLGLRKNIYAYAPHTPYISVVYWYDSDRWSVDTFMDYGIGTIYSTLVHQGELYMATNSASVVKRTDAWFLDGIGGRGYQANDYHYEMKVRTAWVDFGSMSSFTRLRHSYPAVRLAALGDGSTVSFQGLTHTIETDDFPPSVESVTFNPNVFAPGGKGYDGILDLPVKAQKGQRYRFTLQESMQLQPGQSHPPFGPEGYVFVGISWELGVKSGSAKTGQEKNPA